MQATSSSSCCVVVRSGRTYNANNPSDEICLCRASMSCGVWCHNASCTSIIIPVQHNNNNNSSSKLNEPSVCVQFFYYFIQLYHHSSPVPQRCTAAVVLCRSPTITAARSNHTGGALCTGTYLLYALLAACTRSLKIRT